MKNLIVVILLILISGCSSSFLHSKPKPVVNKPTPPEVQVIYKTDWLVMAAIAGLAAAAAAMVIGGPTGLTVALPIAAASGTTLVTVLILAKYATWIALGGLVVLIGIILYIVFIKTKALKEIVAGVQKIKETILTTNWSKDEFNGVLSSVQSPSTQKIVQKIKEVLPDEKNNNTATTS